MRRGIGTVALSCLLCLLVAAASALAAPPRDAEPCDRVETRSALRSFVAAFNRGSFERLDALFAPEPDFQWYSAPSPGRRLGAEAKRRDTLLAYFRRRHARGDRLRLRSFDWNGKSAHRSNFGFLALRSRPGGEGWIRSESKGAAICGGDGASLIVISLGGRPLH